MMFNAVWILIVWADMSRCTERQKLRGHKSGLRSFIVRACSYAATYYLELLW